MICCQWVKLFNPAGINHSRHVRNLCTGVAPECTPGCSPKYSRPGRPGCAPVTSARYGDSENNVGPADSSVGLRNSAIYGIRYPDRACSARRSFFHVSARSRARARARGFPAAERDKFRRPRHARPNSSYKQLQSAIFFHFRAPDLARYLRWLSIIVHEVSHQCCPFALTADLFFLANSREIGEKLGM